MVATLATSQNLVPNWSFEEKDSCPTYDFQLTPACKFWFDPITVMYNPPIGQNWNVNGWGGASYFHECGGAFANVPNNLYGYQYARTGDAYAGTLIFVHDSTLIRANKFYNYIEVELVEPLSKNSWYCAEFYYAMIDPQYIAHRANYELVELGMLFTDTLVRRASGINTQQPQNIYAQPQVSAMMVALDTLSWIKVSGVFKASGGEKFLTIGPFDEVDTINKEIYTFVYFDDVSVYYCGEDTIKEVDSLQIPNVFTPNGDGINEVFEYRNQEQWDFETQVFNRWGGVVYENASSQNWDGRYKGELVSEGVYFYVIKARAKTTGEERRYKGTVSVFYN